MEVRRRECLTRECMAEAGPRGAFGLAGSRLFSADGAGEAAEGNGVRAERATFEDGEFHFKFVGAPDVVVLAGVPLSERGFTADADFLPAGNLDRLANLAGEAADAVEGAGEVKLEFVGRGGGGLLQEPVEWSRWILRGQVTSAR